MACFWGAFSQKSLYVPSSTDVCHAYPFAILLNCHCASGTGVVCEIMYYHLKIYQYNDPPSDCGSQLVSEVTCSQVGISAGCGQDSGAYSLCLNPPPPHFYGWDTGKYKLVVEFFDSAWSGGSTCTENYSKIDTFTGYLSKNDYGWAAITNPCP